jgi:hypothetical protein
MFNMPLVHFYGILTLLLLEISPADSLITKQISIPISKPTLLHFGEEISDAIMGNDDYRLEIIKGQSLLISARNEKARPTTLVVCYIEERAPYVVGVYPDDKAPIKRSMKSASSLAQETAEKDIFPADIAQEYYYGVCKDGITVILTNVLHKGLAVYLRFFIDNTTTTQLKLSNFSFNYIRLTAKAKNKDNLN